MRPLKSMGLTRNYAQRRKPAPDLLDLDFCSLLGRIIWWIMPVLSIRNEARRQDPILKLLKPDNNRIAFPQGHILQIRE